MPNAPERIRPIEALAEARAPRYTSYPTAVQFGPSGERRDLRRLAGGAPGRQARIGLCTTDASIDGGALKSGVDLNPWVFSIGVGRKF
jgi:hypothetical protein